MMQKLFATKCRPCTLSQALPFVASVKKEFRCKYLLQIIAQNMQSHIFYVSVSRTIGQKEKNHHEGQLCIIRVVLKFNSNQMKICSIHE